MRTWLTWYVIVRCRCSDANLIDIPVQIETPDRHYYHVCMQLQLVIGFCVLTQFETYEDCLFILLFRAGGIFHQKANRAI